MLSKTVKQSHVLGVVWPDLIENYQTLPHESKYTITKCVIKSVIHIVTRSVFLKNKTALAVLCAVLG